MLRVIIVDDELDAIKSIALIINEYCDDVEIIGKSTDIKEARELILNGQPDLVILDVEMPNGNGFDLLETISERNFSVIFVTAYNNHAIKAFKYSAIDYILKPIDIDDFILAINKVKHLKTTQLDSLNSKKIKLLLDNIKGNNSSKLVINTSDGVEYINLTDIIKIEGSGSYVKIVLKNGVNHIVSKNLKDFHYLIDSNSFYRTHNSFIINLEHVKKFCYKDGGYIEMIDGSAVPISRKKKEEFLKKMEDYSGTLNP